MVLLDHIGYRKKIMQQSIDINQTEQPAVNYDDPHHLIQMLMDGAIESINSAKSHMEQKDIASKGEDISKAISILTGLMSSLDMEQGGDISKNLLSLYDYMLNKLVEANMSDMTDNLDEVSLLLNEIKEGWATIPSDVRKEFAEKQQ